MGTLDPSMVVLTRSLKRTALLVLLVVAACGSPSASVSSPAASAGASAGASAAPSPSPVPSPAASPTPGGSIDPATCPAYAAGQHPLGPISGPGAGVHADPSLEWQGCGTITLPPGTTRFMTSDNWQVGLASTCPNELNYGAGGMGPNVTLNEILIDGSVGPDTYGGAGPWTDSAGSIMAHGGNYQLRVTSIDTRCRWHVAIYPS
jgi:hypothetical protein